MVKFISPEIPALEDEIIVSKAAINAAKRLELTNVELSEILGISAAQISRISHNKAPIKQNTKGFELALLFIRMFRSLDSLLGGDDHISAKWVRNENLAIGYSPIDRIKKIEGLVDVVSYLDSRRAQV